MTMIITVTLNTSIDKHYLLDAFIPNSVMRVKSVSNTAGGKGLNVSRIVALAGETVKAMGFVGGFNGQYFESLITEPTIEKAFTHVVSETRSCINGWDMTHNVSTEYLEPGSAVTADEVTRFIEDFLAALPEAQVVTISGSMPKGVPVDLYGTLIELCRSEGKPVLLDTSNDALRRAVSAKPNLVKPNVEELTQLLGRTIASIEEAIGAAKELHAGGVERGVVSLGAQGAIIACAEGVFLGVPPQITPVNTVGCGDSMVAGFAIGYARGWKAEETLRYAVAVSAANALSIGTGSYQQSDLERILPCVQTFKMKD